MDKVPSADFTFKIRNHGVHVNYCGGALNQKPSQTLYNIYYNHICMSYIYNKNG